MGRHDDDDNEGVEFQIKKHFVDEVWTFSRTLNITYLMLLFFFRKSLEVLVVNFILAEVEMIRYK